MAWDLPANPVAGTIATVAGWGQKVKDCLEYLKGQAGAITIEDDLTVDNLVTIGLVDGRDVSADGAMLDNHSARHENGGADEISVAGLSGVLGDDQNPVSHAAAKHTDRIRTLFVPFTHGSAGAVRDNEGYFGVWRINDGESVYTSFQIPVGFVALSMVLIGIIPSATGTFDWTCNAEELDDDETVNTDSDTVSVNSTGGSADKMRELSLIGAFGTLTLAAGDWVGLEFQMDVGGSIANLAIVGISVAMTMDE